MNTQTAAAAIETAPAPFTVCALVRTRSETIKPWLWDTATSSHYAGEEYVRVTETGRIEFLPMGEWVLVCASDERFGGYWSPMTREAARALYKAVVAGTHTHYRGTWTTAEPTTKIVGSKAMPARRETFSYGETAYMYTEVDFPAMLCPVIETGRGDRRKTCALQPFAYMTPPTPGDRYSHNCTAIQWTEVRDAS
jgi:hypothetical protein